MKWSCFPWPNLISSPIALCSSSFPSNSPCCLVKPSVTPVVLSSRRPPYNSLVSQLNRWYNKDDVIAEWIEVKGNMCLYVHCFVSGPNLLQELAAEFRYLIFSKELPLVLRAVLYGDSALFKEHPQLTDASVQVFFHSSSKKYNHVECWGALKDAVKGRPRDYINVL
ncbi:unnamed protein product [Cuscuta epithymum]|uniref:Staygreen protein domain-containing protein n=1 Tax=Cuscuta epithymum TaxID=186058 RepID=A0AAV0ESF9_9ASTE|nr:unnamed protein product [Cuscuta epithymum]